MDLIVGPNFAWLVPLLGWWFCPKFLSISCVISCKPISVFTNLTGHWVTQTSLPRIWTQCQVLPLAWGSRGRKMGARCFLGRRKISKPNRRRERASDRGREIWLIVARAPSLHGRPRPLQIPALYLSNGAGGDSVRERKGTIREGHTVLPDLGSIIFRLSKLFCLRF